MPCGGTHLVAIQEHWIRDPKPAHIHRRRHSDNHLWIRRRARVRRVIPHSQTQGWRNLESIYRRLLRRWLRTTTARCRTPSSRWKAWNAPCETGFASRRCESVGVAVPVVVTRRADERGGDGGRSRDARTIRSVAESVRAECTLARLKAQPVHPVRPRPSLRTNVCTSPPHTPTHTPPVRVC